MAPLFDKADTSLLKAWIVKRLENTSDADADVLADYVLALLQHDGDVASIRKLCEEETQDFLKEEDSSTFINDVFKALSQKLYLPPSARPKPAEPRSYDPTQPLEGFEPSQAPAQYPGAASTNGSRKRSYQEHGEAHDPAGYLPDAPRAFKQPRHGYAAGSPSQEHAAATFAYGHPGAPNLLPASSMYANLPAPPLDPTSPQAFQFPPAPFPGQSMGGPNPYMRKKKQRCWEFDAKGYCSRGLTCKFDHSVDLSAMQPPYAPSNAGTDDGYDPSDPTFILHAPPFPMPPPMNPGRGSGRRRRGESRRGGRGRGKAPFSADGPVKDSKRAAIVVENIPEESFSEDTVRDFFSQFGPVVDISMRPYKHLAIVKFDTHDAANAAYRSPKVIFDNRFVKVFWYKEEQDGAPGRARTSDGTNGHEGAPSEHDAPEVDMEEFMQKQAEAQRIYEEKKERRESLQKQKDELDKRQQELIERQLEAKQKLEAKLGNAGPDDATPQSTTESLRAQLKKLEEEAKILGLDPSHDSSHAPEGSWSRGGYRGRGGSRGRGRGGFRGGYGGGYGDVHQAYAAYSLDNRPKKMALTGSDFTVPANDEALKQYLLGFGEYTAVETTPSTTHISFKERRTAESFLADLNGKTLPEQEDILTIEWVPNGTPGLVASEKEEQRDEGMDVEHGKEEAAEEKHEEAEEAEEAEEGEVQHGDMDYEVADDEYEWGR